MLGIVLGIGLLVIAIGLAIDAALPRRIPYRRKAGTPPFSFPAGFVWGAASADHQVEHAQKDDWTALEEKARANKLQEIGDPNNPFSGPKPGHIKGVADVPEAWLQKKTDFDNRFAADFELARLMGHKGHRFSISWARLFPQADTVTPVQAGIDFYSRVVDALLERKMTPMATLHHFAIPQWLAAEKDGKRGVERKDAPEQFARFTEAVVKALGNRITFWTTINEPMVVAFMGYMDGFFPPNERREEKAVRPVVTQLVDMHHAAHAVLKADARRRGSTNQVGIAQHLRTFMPWSNASLLDRVTAWGIDRKFVWEFLDRTASTSDYVGINYYGRYYVKASGIGKFETLSRDESEPGEERSDLGWAADHEGMERALLRTAQRYGKPIWVLENGMADKDDDDARRRRFLIGQTQAIWRAIERGADVRGYMHWALTDNFEWAEGFGPRFGLIKVDYGDDFKRTPRKSAELFTRIATNNTISAEDWAREG